MVRRHRKTLTRTTERPSGRGCGGSTESRSACDSGHIPVRISAIITSTRKARTIMEETCRNKYQPDCPLAHDLMNKLAVIVGQCDLLVEKTPKDSPLFKQTLRVPDLAKAVGSELGQLQFDLARLRTTKMVLTRRHLSFRPAVPLPRHEVRPRKDPQINSLVTLRVLPGS
jgi:hypothetical protein